MSELKKLTREEAIVMTENSLNFWKSGNYKDHDEPDIKRSVEYYEMLLNSLRQPRFTEEEREAMEMVLYHAEADIEIRWGKLNLMNEKDNGHIATVRAMLTDAEIADKGKG